MSMLLQEVYDHRNGWHWICQGDGPMRPIAVEGNTRAEVRQAWMDVFGQQYAEQETLTARSEAHWEKNCEDY